MSPYSVFIAAAVIAASAALLHASDTRETTLRNGPGGSKFITVHASD